MVCKAASHFQGRTQARLRVFDSRVLGKYLDSEKEGNKKAEKTA
jgi:hypothetical protein